MVRDLPLVVLRGEGLGLLVAGLIGYGWVGVSWWLFALLLLAPDIGMLGYLGSPRLGAWSYDLLHTSLAPLALGMWALWAAVPLAMAISLIWLSHIGIDRALGYGLKYESGFKETHLRRL